MKRVLVAAMVLLCGLAFPADKTWAPKNAYTVTVCKTGNCDYQVTSATDATATIQAAVDAAAALATVSTPATVLFLPGVYALGVTGGVDVTSSSYVTIRGTERDAVVIAASDPSVHSFLFAGLSSADLVAFEIADITLENGQASATIDGYVGANAHYFDIAVTNVRFRAHYQGINLAGSSSQDDAPLSRVVVRGCLFEVNQNGITVADGVQLESVGNVFTTCIGDEAFAGAVTPGYEYQSQSGIIAEGQRSGAYALSSGDRFFLRVYDDRTVATPATEDNVNAVSAIRVGEAARVEIRDAFIDVAPTSDNDDTLYGTGIYIGGQNGQVDVFDSVLRYGSVVAGHSMYGITHAGGDQSLILHNVRFERSFGAGTEYDLNIREASTALGVADIGVGEILLDSTRYDTANDEGTVPIRNLHPKVGGRDLWCVDSIGTPADAAAFDGTSEYRLFDDTTAENTSWRNLRMGSYFESESVYTPEARVYWKPAAAAAGGVSWKIGICSAGEDDAYPCSVSSWGTVADDVCATCTAGDLHVTAWVDLPASILAADEAFVVQVQRDPTSGDDDMVGDAALISVELRYGVK